MARRGPHALIAWPRRPVKREPLTDEQIHVYTHDLIRMRLLALIADDLKGVKLRTARDIAAYTIAGHARLWPTCAASAWRATGAEGWAVAGRGKARSGLT